MFAPLVARAQKAVANPISGMAPQCSRPFGDNTAANLTNGEKPRGVSWDLSKIAVFPPDPAGAPAPTVARLPGVIQPKLVVGQVDDPLEHEADRVAEQVMRDPGQAVSLTAASPQLSRKCAACEEEENSLRMNPARSDASGAPAPALVHEVLSSPGRSLDAPTRAFFEPRFGHDFGAVRIYDDGQAAASARSMGALAYTVGRDIVFGRGEYAAGTDSGRRLLAHELAHVMQQAGTTQYLRRVPCRSAAQCAAPAPGDPGTASTNVEKERQDRDAALAAAPLGSAAAAKKARLGERAAHLENLLIGHGSPLRPEVAGFFVDPARPANWLGTAQCQYFPGGSPGTPPMPADKFCVQVPAEVEDRAKSIDINTPLSDKQREDLAALLAIGSHEMQHASFDNANIGRSPAPIAEMAMGPGRGPRADCTLDMMIGPDASVGNLLSEISALTSEFPIFFKNIAQQKNPEAALESHERFNAITSQESMSGAITRLQCGCSCALADDLVFSTVMSTMASWSGDERLAFLRTMTRMIPGLWPKNLQLPERLPPPGNPPPVTSP